MIVTLTVAATYPLVIQYRRGGIHNILAPIALLFVALDALANYTELSFVFGLPEKGDWTITHRLRRMEREDPIVSRRELARIINTYLHACEADGQH